MVISSFERAMWWIAMLRAACLGMFVQAWVAQCITSCASITTCLSSDELLHSCDDKSPLPSLSEFVMIHLSSQYSLSGINDLDLVSDKSEMLGGLSNMPWQSLISDLISLAVRYSNPYWIIFMHSCYSWRMFTDC